MVAPTLVVKSPTLATLVPFAFVEAEVAMTVQVGHGVGGVVGM